jgi:hypothetical protein
VVEKGRTVCIYYGFLGVFCSARSFSQKIRELAPLPNTYNIENTRDLIEKLKHTPISPNVRFASLDITNLHTNIPVKETRDVLSSKLEQNNIAPKKNKN